MMPPTNTQSRSVHLVTSKLATAREAFRSQQMASQAARRYNLYREHSLPGEAARSRTQMLEHLREARRQWRALLGLNLEE